MISRRAILAGASVGAAILTGCQTYGDESPSGPSGSQPLGRVEDIPVGGGTVFSGQQVVLTQPKPGEIKAFSAVCTHQGCTVAEVSSGTIICPCHGSAFHIADGTVVTGPAVRSLSAKSVTVVDGVIQLS